MLFVLGDQELAGEQEFKDTPFDQGKPQYSGHEELGLFFAKFDAFIWILLPYLIDN